MTPRPLPSRRSTRGRARTWRLLAVPVLGVVALVLGMVWLEAQAPTVDDRDLSVQGVPPLAIEADQPCVRSATEETSEDTRIELPPRGRVSSSQVFACPMAFDGLRVSFAGEVVGELLERDGGAWAQINDDPYALDHGPIVAHSQREGFNSGLAVWLPDELHERISGVGRPQQRGDVVLLQGVLQRADEEDGGGTTLRADRMEVLAEATRLRDPLHVTQAIVAGVLSLAAAAAWWWARRVSRR